MDRQRPAGRCAITTVMADQFFPLNQPGSYIRVQTSYYKRTRQPMVTGGYTDGWLLWSSETLKKDLSADAIKKIRKFDAYCCVPSHTDYRETIGNYFNKYHPLEFKPEPGSCDTILDFLRHIFAEQYEMGLDYIALLYTRPVIKLPILCLVSKERKTGKTTFLDLLKVIFGNNMTFNGNHDFRSQFNSDWMNTLIIAVEEVLLDKKEDSEKIKNLSTAKVSKVEAKSKDKRETEFFGKFIMCSNNEYNFIVIEPTETRYWVRKVPVFEKENVRLLEQMTGEIPAFLFHLLERPLSVPVGNTRMWFSEQQIRTDALLRVMRNNRNRLETELLLLFKEIQEHDPGQKMCFANKDILDLLKKSMPRLTRQDVSQLMQQEWALVPVPNSLSYSTYCYNNLNELVTVAKTGRYYTITEEWLRQKFDESG